MYDFLCSLFRPDIKIVAEKLKILQELFFPRPKYLPTGNNL